MHVFSKFIISASRLKLPNYYNFISRQVFRPKKQPKCLLYFSLGLGFTTPFILNRNGIINGRCFSVSPTNKHISIIDKSEVEEYTLWSFIYPETILILLSILGAIVAAAMNISIPLDMGELVNAINSNYTEEKKKFIKSLMNPALKLLFHTFIQAISTTFYISILSTMGERIAMNIRLRVFEKILLQDMFFFDSKRSGDLLNRLTIDVQDFKSSFKMIISQGLKSCVQIIGSSIALFYISKELTVGLGLGISLMVTCGSIMGQCLRALSKQAQTQLSLAANTANEALVNIRTVKSFAMEDIEIRSYNKEVSMSAQKATILGIGIGIFQGITNFSINNMVLGVMLSGAYMLNQNLMTAGDLMSFLIASQNIQKSLATISTLLSHVVKLTTSKQRIFEILLLPTCETTPTLKELAQCRGKEQISDYQINHAQSSSLEFKDVCFEYPSREGAVLKHVNLKIPAGKVVSLCGESGAGKSTMASLIQRLYDPISGSILIDDVDIRKLSVCKLRLEEVGIVSQQPQLFATSIMENIRYGYPNATDEEVMQVAYKAQAHDFIMSFKDGYHTLVGERGGEALSGGQRQRIAIARALLKNPKILILDEATSALDANSETMVSEALNTVMKGRTVIKIAHRLSTIRDSDFIVVMDQGEIIETGSHSELMEKKHSQYRKLVENQERKNSHTY